MSSHWTKWLSEPGNIRIVAIEATDLMHELILQQGLNGSAQSGYADAILTGLLVASAHKASESINLNAQGSGVYKQAIVDASPEGRVRGFLIEESNLELHTYGSDGKAGPWGTGILSVLYTKNFEGKIPYRGIVPISSGYLDEAINEYYRDSEQLTSLVGLNLEFDGQALRAARGALVQALGGASPEELQLLKSLKIEDLRALAKFADNRDSFSQQASQLLPGFAFKLVETQNLKSFCNCSLERIERALVLTGYEDAMHALGNDPSIKVTCDFCRSEYQVSAEKVKSLFTSDSSGIQ